jgi:excisionase family DNA binding protein
MRSMRSVRVQNITLLGALEKSRYPAPCGSCCPLRTQSFGGHRMRSNAASLAPVAKDVHPHQYISIAQFAALRGVSKDTIRREIAKGRIVAKKVSERRVAIPATELLK